MISRHRLLPISSFVDWTVNRIWYTVWQLWLRSHHRLIYDIWWTLKKKPIVSGDIPCYLLPFRETIWVSKEDELHNFDWDFKQEESPTATRQPCTCLISLCRRSFPIQAADLLFPFTCLTVETTTKRKGKKIKGKREIFKIKKKKAKQLSSTWMMLSLPPLNYPWR